MDVAPAKLQTKWLWFWTYIRIPLGIFVSVIVALNSTTLVAYMNVLLALWLAFLFFGLKDRRHSAWTQNMWLLFLEPVLRAVGQYQVRDLNAEQIGYDIAAALTIVVFWLCWSWPNFIYFKKREHLFR